MVSCDSNNTSIQQATWEDCQYDKFLVFLKSEHSLMRPKRPNACPYHVPLNPIHFWISCFFHVLVYFTTLSARRTTQTRLVKCKRFENYRGLAEVRINLEVTFRYRNLKKNSGKITDNKTVIWTGIFWTRIQRCTATLAWLVLNM